MRGYILNVKKHRDEDLIASVLTADRLLTLYRFYGARHSPLQLGYKIDFTTENDPFFMPRLRGVSHLGYEWLFDHNKMRHWQRFIQLLHKHLSGIEEIDEFYFDLLNRAAETLNTRSVKRVLSESFCALLSYEGRLQNSFICAVCEKKIDDRAISLLRNFAPSHIDCGGNYNFDRKSIGRLFESYETIYFNDDEVEKLWRIIENGI
ncbi:recombination protein RecO [Campylobacterota bacterium]|nr:recombination protein RecO [Campylobacterota bacterium]